MLQKKSAFDILMNKNKTQPAKVDQTSPRVEANNKRVSGAGGDGQKENIPGESKRKSNKFEDTIVLDSSVVDSSPNTSLNKNAALSESAKKFNDFFAKREKPSQAKPPPAIPIEIIDDAPSNKIEMNRQAIHVKQFNDLDQKFLNESLDQNKSWHIEHQQQQFDISKMMLNKNPNKPFYILESNAKIFVPECKCSIKVKYSFESDSSHNLSSFFLGLIEA